MIIPGNAVLSMFSPPPELQGSREEESGFGQLLTEIEHQTTPLPDQEDGERRALESVLQVLVSMFQSFTPTSPATAVATPRAGEAGVVSVGLAGGPALGWPPGLAPAAGLGETGNVNLPPGLILVQRQHEFDGFLDPMSLLPLPGGEGKEGARQNELDSVLDASHDIGQPTFPATAVLQESMQDLREFFMTPPTTSLSLEARGSSTTGALAGLPIASTPTAQLGTPSGATSLDTTASFSGDSVLATAERSNPLPVSALAYSRATVIQRPQQPGASSTPDLVQRQHEFDGFLDPMSLLPLPPGEGRGEGPRPELGGLLSQAAPPHPNPLPGGEGKEGARQNELDSVLELRSPVGPMQPEGAPAAIATPGTVQTAAAYVEEAPASLLAIPQADAAAQVAADSYGLRTMSGVKEEGALAERDHSPSPRRATESKERASDAMPSVPYLAADGAFPSPLTGATSHTSSDGSDTSVPPPSRSLEDVMGSRQWPRPWPANTMLLHLDPPELGALLVQVRVSEKRLIASFRAQSPEAEALLRIHLPALHESLSQQGFEVRPIVITQASEGFSSHLGAGTGAFAQQHSASQGFTQDRQAAGAEETQNEMDRHRTAHWPAEQRLRLLDVMV